MNLLKSVIGAMFNRKSYALLVDRTTLLPVGVSETIDEWDVHTAHIPISKDAYTRLQNATSEQFETWARWYLDNYEKSRL